jgi:hypothetical protein
MQNECYLNIKTKCIRDKIAFRKKENNINKIFSMTKKCNNGRHKKALKLNDVA